MVLEVIERKHQVVVGRFFRAGGMSFVSPDHRNLPHDVAIPDGEGRDGEMVVVELAEPPVGEGRDTERTGRIVERLGDPERPGMAAEIAIRSHGIPHVWPEDALAEAERLPLGVTDIPDGRTDLRDLPLVTIDGADAKDFDDAVHCDPRPGGWKLTVAIADVSHYVAPGSALDREASVRGTSVYFPGRVVPMLPERLSNGLCSLNPEVDSAVPRLRDARRPARKGLAGLLPRRGHAFAGAPHLRGGGDGGCSTATRRCGAGSGGSCPVSRRSGRSTRRCARRAGGGAPSTSRSGSLACSSRRTARSPTSSPRPGASPTSSSRSACSPRTSPPPDGLPGGRIPFLYRVHPPPDEEGLRELGAFLGRAGIDFDPGEEPRPGAFAEAAERAAGRPDTEILHLALLRAMAKADYRPRNIGHFGLALERYTHFTSPIRRYPDLLVHRALKGEAGGTREEMAALGRSTSAAERRAEEASRDAVSRLVCQHLRSRVGEVFAGRITGVVSFGVFVRLDGLQVDGLAHVRSLGGDWYRFDRDRRCLVGEATGRRFAVGDPMSVRVTGADPDERRVHLEPVERDGVPAGGEGGSGREARRGPNRSGGRSRAPGPRPGGGRGKGRSRRF